MKKHSIGLIVIDSIAGVFRLDTAAITRAEKMRKVALTLQTLADQYECAVVCTNQVSLHWIKKHVGHSIMFA